MAKKAGHPTTCFMDAEDRLYGKLYLEKGIVYDFDTNSIYVDDVKQKVNSSHVRLLFEMLKSESVTFRYDKLYDIYSEYECRDADNWKQIITNFKNQMSKYAEFETTQKVGYCVVLPQKIKRFDDIPDGSKVYDIPALFKTPKTPEEIAAEEEFEKTGNKFLHGGATDLIDEGDPDKITYALHRLSRVFNLNTYIFYNDETLAEITKDRSVVYDMYKFITRACRKTDARNILKIEGPFGSYKNRVMQYIYVKIKDGEADTDILPFYIDLAYYERLPEKEGTITEHEFFELFKEDFAKFISAIEREPDKIPLLFLDGIRDFKRGNEYVYEYIEELLAETECRIVASVDCDFTMNEQQKFDIHPLVPDNFEAEASISSMSLNYMASIDFIKQCLIVFEDKLKENYEAEDIYKVLVSLDFISVDAYWLISLLSKCGDKLMNSNSTIANIYEDFCKKVCKNCGYPILDKAADVAYNFEYAESDSEDASSFDMCWRLIRKHRSILEYLIAKWYVKRLSALDFVKDSPEETVRKLSFLNMVPQRNVTRFIIAMIKGNDGYEKKIMSIADRYYDELNWLGKSEIAFWLGRLSSVMRKSKCVERLKEYRVQALADYEKGEFKYIADKKNAAFLLRSINISLLYENDEDAFVYYMNSLIRDKTANSINRGFHLEYYGDKPYIPTNSLLDYEDDVTIGDNALTVLTLSLEERMRNGDQVNYTAVLEFITLCNLIQARLERCNDEETLHIQSYIPKCIIYYIWVNDSGVLDKVPDVKNYFSWMYRRLKQLSRYIQLDYDYHSSSVYNEFSRAGEVERTGWKDEGLPKPENIVEHMYNCWLIGMLYLPKEYHEPGYAGYDKNTVLNMLLIHDLGETVTGDIARPEKDMKREKCDREERKAMHDLLFTGTYPSSVDLSEYLGCWNEWDKKPEERGINALVAKDIDNLQTTFRFCQYYIDNPGKFDEERVRYWLGDIKIIKTQIGKRIMDTLVVKNPQFADILKIIG